MAVVSPEGIQRAMRALAKGMTSDVERPVERLLDADVDPPAPPQRLEGVLVTVDIDARVRHFGQRHARNEQRGIRTQSAHSAGTAGEIARRSDSALSGLHWPFIKVT